MTSLTQYCAWAERQIAAVVVSEGLHCGLAQVVQGPMTLTFRLRLLRPNRAELARLLGLGPTLAQALQSPRVRVADTAQGVLVEVPSPAPRTPSAEDLATATRGPAAVAVGVDSFRRPVYLDFDRNAHLLAVGPTRRGKTEAVKSLLYALAMRSGSRNLAYLILAKKASDWQSFAAASGCYGVLAQDGEIEGALSWLAGDVLQNRTRNGQRDPALFLVADDLANIAARANIAGLIGEIASMGGGVGMHLIISTQSTGRAGGLSQDLEANLTARLVFGATDAAAAARYAGSGGTGADLVGTSPGDALLIVDGLSQRVATARADDRLIALLPAGKTPQPWRNRRNQENQAADHPAGAATRGGDGAGAGGEPGAKPVRLFDLSQPVTPAERDQVRGLYAQLGSMNKACRAAYGSKNGKTWPRLQSILADESEEKPTGEGGELPDTIDLSTDQGRALFADWQSAGLVHFPAEQAT
ncbi:MAG: hypothetical protein J5I90_06395 [Caldilineales bacterium]|nr:hypothetical protein [Caldilineales bacterium]